MVRKKYVIVVTLFACFLFLFIIHQLIKNLTQISVPPKIQKWGIEGKLNLELEKLPRLYTNPEFSQATHKNIEKILENLSTNNSKKPLVPLVELWQESNGWINANRQITNISSSHLYKFLNAMKTANIIEADLDSRGTQLKLLLTLTGKQKVIFKPKWYEKEKIITGQVYAGKDRYQAEILAFYLSILLDLPLVPLSTERVISLKYEILPVATKRLLNTSFERDGKTCVYGKCFYCSKQDPICDKEHDFLTGAVILNINKSFRHYPSPWQRSYKKTVKPKFETETDYCKTVKKKISHEILLDLVDTAIFDFLLQNGDRHHYETFDDQYLVWIDNGKGLGNPNIIHFDILAPLYQCCILRNEMKQKLLNLSGGRLRKYLKQMPDIEKLLTDTHLYSLERRLDLVFAAIEYCKNELKAQL